MYIVKVNFDGGVVKVVESSSLVWKISERDDKIHKNPDPEILGRKKGEKKHWISEDSHKMTSFYSLDPVYKAYKMN